MIEAAGYARKTVAVLGLGKSGLASALALRRGGADVWAWDDSAVALDKARAEGFLPVELAAAALSDIAALILAPGIPHTFPEPHPVVARFRAAGIPVIGDVELLRRSRPDAVYVGITGTNGKSTTTALIAHILASAGRRMAIGGNFGPPVLSLPPFGPGEIYVLELSSYQLELAPSLVPDVAILLNITPDHLERHGGMDGYIAAKKLIFRGQKTPKAAVIGIDDPICRSIRDELARDRERTVIAISAGDPIDAANERLPGSHNRQNIAAAYAACRHLGLTAAAIRAGIRSFPGLAHRQELLPVRNGVRWINDSKATNADAAAKALVCYENIYWIAGGLPKEGGIDTLAPFFPRIRHAFLIGKAEAEFAGVIGDAIPFTRCGDLARAVAEAAAMAPAGSVVLLSPACASFDQFTSFEHRGDVFRALVAALPGGAT